MSKHHGQMTCSRQALRQIALIFAISLGSLFGQTAHATGYYNFGMHWKGGLNPYHLQSIPTYQSGFTSGFPKAVSGYDDGMLGGSMWVAVSSSGNIYVSDASSNRISKYDSTGVFQGWIGKILTSPTGGAAGCNGAAVGTITPGWCRGGRSDSGSADGMLAFPIGITVDASENIYVVDSGNDRISKYNSSGVFQGWIGRIATSPTGGAAGCSGASVGTATPGWCTGGTSSSGTGDGMFEDPREVAVDSTGNVYVTDGMGNHVDKFNSAGVFQGWIGSIGTSPTGGAAGCNGAGVGTFTPGWCTGGAATNGTGDGMLDAPEGIAVDSSGNLYVVDFNNGRINKYNSAGAFQGWIGTIDSIPSGGAAGCASASIGDLTPGWCTGGVSIMSGGDGGLSEPDSITLDSSGNLYVTSANSNRVNKYNSSGAYQGWIGGIQNSPTGGASGCNGATVGTITPGWCTGGAALPGIGDGMLDYPLGIAVNASTGELYIGDSNNTRINRYTSSGAFSGAIQTISIMYPWGRSNTSLVGGISDGVLSDPKAVARDASGNIYVADFGNSRISKYNSAGVFQGWIGEIDTSPTGGAAGCSGAPVGSFTPGWCKGGMSSHGTGDGMLYGPTAIAIDSSGNLYVADALNNRLSKYSSSGTFIGWIGKIDTSPTGGATGCNGAAVGSITPGWCTGGTADTSWDFSGNGTLAYPSGVALDSSSNLYVSSNIINQIIKYNSSGAFQGWIGKIASSPTGGATGCNGAGAGTVTPGWCIGGTSASGQGDGMLYGPTSIAIDPSGNLYVADSNNGRINKYASSGATLGWIGKVLTSPTGGASGCNGASVGTTTPGWCTGGTSVSGNGDGQVDTSNGVTLDSVGNLYIADSNNNRIEKYNSAGVFQGWIGKILSSPTGGATGCNGAAVGTLTPGWCTGGGSDIGSEDGSMYYPMGLTLDSAGNLYVADAYNNRVIRYSLQGR